MAFFDDDEYLYLKHYNSVNELLDSAHDDTGQIIIPWLNYGPNKQVLSPSHRDTRLSWFNTREHNVKNSNGLITSLFKVIVKLDDIIGVIDNARYYNDWYYCHSLKHIKGSWRDTDGNMPNLVQPGLYNGCVISPSQVLLTEEPDNVCLVHYQIGSMEDHIRRHQIWEKTFSTNSERKLTCSFDQFIYSASNFTIEDNRMLKYKIELKNLLQQCQAT